MKELDELSVEMLLNRIQCGDEKAFASLMRRFYRDLYHYASKFTRDDSMIKDCIQEVFISLWQRRDAAQKILAPRYYLLRATKNKVLKALSRNSNFVPLQDHARDYGFYMEFSAEHMMIEKKMTEEKARKLSVALSQLSAKQKEIVYLKFYQYLDCSQIADLMALNRQSVYNLLHETITRLRKFLREELINQ